MNPITKSDAVIQNGFICPNKENLQVGSHLVIDPNVSIYADAKITIGDHVHIGPSCIITTANVPFSPAKRRAGIRVSEPISIGSDVWIAENVTILPGTVIGSNVIIAAGSVVNGYIPDNCMAGGNPVRMIRTLDNDV